jgi:hypothetical protein
MRTRPAWGRAAGVLPGISAIVLAAALAGAAQAQETVLVALGEEWLYFKGTEDPPPDWNQQGFDDTAWLAGPTGIGYADGDDATVLSDMQNVYMSVFTRKTFDVPNAAAVTTLVLRVNYDDGFIAYLNGVEAARSSNMGAAGTLADRSFAATPDHEVAAIPESFILDASLLDNGENLLAVQVHNTQIGSSDLSFRPELVSEPDLCPLSLACAFNSIAGTVGLTWLNRTTSDAFEIYRDGVLLETVFDGTLQAYTDSLPPTGSVEYSVVATLGGSPCAALECTVTVFAPSDIAVNAGDVWRFFRGSAPPPLDWSEIDFDDASWESGPTGIGYGDGDDATILDDMLMRADDPATAPDETQAGYLAVFLRKEFHLAAAGDGVLSIVYDDGFVAYVNGVEVGRANMPAGAVSELTPASAAIDPGSPIEIPVPASTLRAGTNVLAASVHNANLTSSDLSFIPVLAFASGGGAAHFRRGDITDDGGVNITDAVFLLDHLFRSGPAPACADAADVNDDGGWNLTDPVFLLNVLFQGFGDPPPPGLTCGPDPTADPLGNCATSGC